VPQRSVMSIGVVLNLVSLMGKHQKIAMEIAVKDSHGNSAQVISTGNFPSNS
jgi:hypothetical protein